MAALLVTGAPDKIVKIALLDVTESELTVIFAVPGVAIRAAGTVATNCPALTNVVANAEPLKATSEVDTNPVPCTVKTKFGLPAATAAGTKPLIPAAAGAAGMANETKFDCGPPGSST